MPERLVDRCKWQSFVYGLCRREMANYKAPRYFWLIDELPLNPSNKVLKTELRARAAALLT